MHETIALLLGYIDPGTGTLIWQAIAAGLVAVAVFFRSKLASVFKRSQDKHEPEQHNADETHPSDVDK